MSKQARSRAKTFLKEHLDYCAKLRLRADEARLFGLTRIVDECTQELEKHMQEILRLKQELEELDAERS